MEQFWILVWSRSERRMRGRGEGERVFLQVNENRQKPKAGGGYEKSTEADFFLAVRVLASYCLLLGQALAILKHEKK